MRSLCKKLEDLKRKENDLAMQGWCLEMYAKQLEEYCLPNDPSLTMDASELVSNQEVLKSVRNEIQILKNSITNSETELKMRSAEFLGVDSAQRLYWIMELVERPQIIVAEGNSQDYQPRCSWKNSVSIGNKDLSSAGGSEARCPMYEDRYRNAALASWLKESISQCHRLQFRDPHKSESQNENELQLPFLKPSDNFSNSDCLITKAFKLLVSKYGAFQKTEMIDSLKNRGKMEKVVVECKMYRCTCLEPIPPTADHCLICHKTSFNKIELKEHNQKCVVPASSSKPAVCKASHVLKQLKINLLDMYAALPEEALRSSKACFDRRCSWRAVGRRSTD
ncbi:unnamed protein product [Fraxinus pennsylvanica]|uniref:Uncharacterized protein n=1 Tax=Fraxinus pennsylvanica TaxID=56036 RepID=A0AAD2DL59_9LAMI|nr:unnamed protein product [Fraxinus pennsylvanica]